VDHQRPDVADVGQMAAQLHGLNGRPARSAATPHTELGAATRELFLILCRQGIRLRDDGVGLDLYE
jgi:hypothetical protein